MRCFFPFWKGAERFILKILFLPGDPKNAILQIITAKGPPHIMILGKRHTAGTNPPTAGTGTRKPETISSAVAPKRRAYARVQSRPRAIDKIGLRMRLNRYTNSRSPKASLVAIRKSIYLQSGAGERSAPEGLTLKAPKKQEIVVRR